jgi:uncharacterized protein
VTRDDFLLKRLRIERGELKTWSRYSRRRYSQRTSWRDWFLHRGLQLLGLYQHGESNARTPVIKRLVFSFETLPEAFDGFTILHLTDLHADGLTGFADDLHNILRTLEVDLCVLTGDYRFDVTGPCENVYAQMERILSGINARHGVVGVLGNHDWYEMVPELEKLGVKMLVNASLAIDQEAQRIWLLGVDDPHYYGCADLPGALSGVPADAFKILLIHTPELFAEAAAHNVHLYLCGHTHGGQVCLPLFGPLITNANCPRAYVRGHWRHETVQGYTSTGVGTSGVPVRFFCPAEIGLITLQRGTTGVNLTIQDGLQKHLTSSI